MQSLGEGRLPPDVRGKLCPSRMHLCGTFDNDLLGCLHD